LVRVIGVGLGDDGGDLARLAEVEGDRRGGVLEDDGDRRVPVGAFGADVAVRHEPDVALDRLRRGRLLAREQVFRSAGCRGGGQGRERGQGTGAQEGGEKGGAGRGFHEFRLSRAGETSKSGVPFDRPGAWGPQRSSRMALRLASYSSGVMRPSFFIWSRRRRRSSAVAAGAGAALAEATAWEQSYA